MEHQVLEALNSDNYSKLNEIFTSSWLTLGQGEQRSLSAYFIKAALSSATFLPTAFSSENELALNVMKITLAHLPPSVENAQDNILRLKIFNHLVETVQDFHAHAIILLEYSTEWKTAIMVIKTRAIHIMYRLRFKLILMLKLPNVFFNKIWWCWKQMPSLQGREQL